MKESKGALADRLRREGRWDAFVRRREVLKTEGVEAGEAWTIAAAEFPPATPADAAQPNLSVSREELEALRSKPRVGFAQAIEWTLDHLDCEWVESSDAPDATSWSLLRWARSSPSARSEFHRSYAGKLWQAQLESVEDELDYDR